ncbi:hypothetical protein G7046_g8904 [Stylonectria norvegica]|nr:hypothetical protein G7046_g8904 [Stylonectria norvegica]
MAPLSMLLLLSLLIASVTAQSNSSDDKVWASVAFINNGERTPLAGDLRTVLTPKGAQQMLRQGTAFRARYTQNGVNDSDYEGIETAYLQGLSTHVLDNSELDISSQTYEWVVGGATAFLQGLYPPTPGSFDSSTGGISIAREYALGDNITNYPLDGYQYPAIRTLGNLDLTSTGIQGTTRCSAWETEMSTNLTKQETWQNLYDVSFDFYQEMFSTAPLVGSIDLADANIWNAYAIYDYVNYMHVHNETVYENLKNASSKLFYLQSYATQMERAKNVNANGKGDDDPTNVLHTIAGRTLANSVALQFLSNMRWGGGRDKLTLMFGSYEPILSFLFISGITDTARSIVSGPFASMPQPGAAMIFEMYGENPDDPNQQPSFDDLSVRFLYRASADADEAFVTYPLFDTNGTSLTYSAFINKMSYYAVDAEMWCDICGPTPAPWCTGIQSSGGSKSSSDPNNGTFSPAVAGIVGAVLTGALLLVVVGSLFAVGGWRFKRPDQDQHTVSAGGFKGPEKKDGDKDVAVAKTGAQHERVGSWELRDGSSLPVPGSDGARTKDLSRTRATSINDDDDISIMGATPAKISWVHDSTVLRRSISNHRSTSIDDLSSHYGLQPRRDMALRDKALLLFRRSRITATQPPAAIGAGFASGHPVTPRRRKGNAKPERKTSHLAAHLNQHLSIPSMAFASQPEETPAVSSFEYTKFEDNFSIRILTLEPGTGDDPLVGHLSVENLDFNPDYEAISYVWGTEGRSSQILVDGKMLPLTRSIQGALQRMRHASLPRRLWADQICINQEDIAERSQQVGLMNAIYKGAKHVLVWLGPDKEGVAEVAFSMVHHLHGVFNDEEAHEAFKVAYSEHLLRQSNKPWVPFSKLTKLPWFNRIWIVQEIGTAAPATLYWGDAEVDWDILSSVAGVLNQKYHYLRTRFAVLTPNIRYLHQRFVEPDEEYDANHNRGSFIYELHRARHLLAKDPRDHVYAFLGHFSIHTGSKELVKLEADYSRSVEDVFYDVAALKQGSRYGAAAVVGSRLAHRPTAHARVAGDTPSSGRGHSAEAAHRRHRAHPAHPRREGRHHRPAVVDVLRQRLLLSQLPRRQTTAHREPLA